MNVLMTADAVGGVWSYALTLAGALAPRGVRVTLAVMGPAPNESQRAAARAVPGLRVVDRPCKLEWMDDPWDDVERAGSWLLGLERELRPDVVHLNGYAHAALSWRAPVVVVAHSCVLSWWEAVRGEPAPAAAWAEYRARVTAGLAAAHAVVAPTTAMLRALERHYGRLRAASVVPNAAAPLPLGSGGDGGPKEPIVLSAGRLWDEAKNVAALDAAAAGLPWPVFVAGSGEHPGGQRVTLGVARPLGALSATELAGWMRRAAVYALPARYEPFGLSVLEAALAGCALVLGDIPSLREVWGNTAVYVPPDSSDALARALRALADDPLRCTALAARAQARARRYTPTRMARAYEALYERLRTGVGGRVSGVAGTPGESGVAGWGGLGQATPDPRLPTPAF